MRLSPSLLMVLACAVLSAGCNSTSSTASVAVSPAIGNDSSDPYPGNGGLLFGTPSKQDVASGRAVFDRKKFEGFVVGTSTKRQVVRALGEPAFWTSKQDGTSQLMYHYVDAGPQSSVGSFGGMRRIIYVFLNFDAEMKLKSLELPDSSG